MRFIWPLDSHYITRGFDYKSSIYIGGQHAAVDLVRLQGDTAGREIKAVADGVVVGDGFDSISGFHIVLDHGGWRSMYRHLVMDAPPIMDQQIKQGEVIGNVGTTGMSTGPHLHFDLWHRQKQDDTAFSKSGWWAHNPELYLGQGEDLPTEEDIMKWKFIKAPEGPEWVTNGFEKMGVKSNQIKTDLVNLGLAVNDGPEGKPWPVAQEFADWLIDIAAATTFTSDATNLAITLTGTAKAAR